MRRHRQKETDTMTKSFEVIATSTGHSFGVYEADSEAAAIAAMIADSGAPAGTEPDADIVAKQVEG